MHGKTEGPAPNLNIELEIAVQKLALDLIRKGVVKSAHDLSDGGLAVNISESIFSSRHGIGAEIDIKRKLRNDELLFGECQSVIIITIDKSDIQTVTSTAQKLDVYTQAIGRVTDTNRLKINDAIDIDRESIEDVYMNSLERSIGNE